MLGPGARLGAWEEPQDRKGGLVLGLTLLLTH